MTKSGPRKKAPFHRTRRHVGRLIGFLLLLLVPAVLVLSGGVRAPGWMTAQFQSRLNASIAPLTVGIGGVNFRLFANGFNPEIVVDSISVMDARGRLRAVLPKVRGELSGLDLLVGRIRPVTLGIQSANLQLHRDKSGRFDLSIGQATDHAGSAAAGDPVSPVEQSETLTDIVGRLEAMLQMPVLQKLRHVQSTDTSVIIEDELSGRDWQFHHGVMDFNNADSGLSASMTFQLANKTGKSAQATFSFSKAKGASLSDISTRFSGFRARDVADQVAALDWLRVLNAPISGSVSLAIQPDGSFGDMFGVLDIGAGQLTPGEDAKPVRFIGAKAYLSYNQAQEKLTFDQISVDTGAAKIQAEGQAYLSDRINRSVGAVVGQFKFSKVLVNPDGVFGAPVRFDLGALDMRVRFKPFKVDIGQMVLVDGPTRYTMRGVLAADNTGWTSKVDFDVNRIGRDRILQLWPLASEVKTRAWVKENITTGTLSDLTGAFRASPGQAPVFTLGFNINDVTVRYMKTLPPIVGGSGYGVLNGKTLDVVVEKGHVSAPIGGDIDVAGSSFRIADVTIPHAPIEITLKTGSSLQAALSILDQPPLNFISKGGLTPEVATGQVALSGTLGMPLSKKVTLDQITFEATAELKNVKSTRLVKGKTVTAKRLDVFADDAGVTISGDALLNGLPVSGTWQQKFGPEYKGISRLDGQIELSKRFLDEFNIVLPKGSVTGKGHATMTIDLVRGKPPAFKLVSDLNQIGLKLDAIGWRKAKNRTAHLLVDGQFGTPVKISKIEITAPGLTAKGTVALNKNGGLRVARFNDVKIAGWLKSRIEIRPGADGNAKFSLKGGVIDLRKSQFGDSLDTGGDSPISLNIDRIILSSGISLRDVKGAFNTKGGLNGDFTATVNGGAPITGTLATVTKGTAVRFRSNDAGAVLKSAGLFTTAVGGDLSVILAPTGGRGEYDGKLTIKRVKVRNAPALAGLLNAVSVVGLLEQLDGEGITFNDVEARFHLSPKGLALTRSSAVGLSMGLTMEGAYDFAADSINMQGVLTPIYLLNGFLEQMKIFGPLFGKQKGEGLFGFNYTLKGPVDDPKVAVNPLSILTPGLFREIFHRPIPKVPK